MFLIEYIRWLIAIKEERGRTFSALGATGEPEGGLLPLLSATEIRLSGGLRDVLVLPKVGQPVSLAGEQTGHSKCVAKDQQVTEVV